MTVDSSGLSFGYEPSNAGFPDATLTPDSFAYKGIQYEVDRLTAAGGEDLVLILEPKPSEEIEKLLTLVIGTGHFPLEGSYIPANQQYVWSVSVPTWTDGQNVSVSIEEDIVGPAADVIVQPSTTVSVPWSGTVTMDAGAQYTGYSSARISSDGSLAPTTLSVLGNTYTVEALRYDDTATDLELSLSPKFPLRYRLLAAGLGPFNSTSSTATDLAAPLDNVTRYLWDQTDPGWAEGDRVAFAIRVNKSFPPTGAPSISGTVADGETLTVVTSAIGDPNGLTSPTFTYQWERVDCATTADNGVIAGQTAQTYTVGAADAGCSIKATVTFKDDDGYGHSLSDSITADPGVRIRPISLTIYEGSTAEYTVRLQAEPTADVTVTLNTAGLSGTGLTVDTTSLTFTTTNWNTAQAVTLSAAHDDDIDDVENLQITHGASSSDSDYQGITVDTVQVTIVDDDQIVELAQPANEVTEGAIINFSFLRTGI